MKDFDKWFSENETKFDYPRLAHKSAKSAWIESNKNTLNLINDLGVESIDDLCVEWEETRNMNMVVQLLVRIIKDKQND